MQNITLNNTKNEYTLKQKNKNMNEFNRVKLSKTKCHDSVSFGRAPTTEEKKALSSVIQTALKKLGIKRNAIIIHSPSFPAYKVKEEGKEILINTGVGSSSSEGAKKFLKFTKEIFGVNSVQLGPESIVTGFNLSPYSGSSFSLGSYVVDPIFVKKLGLANSNAIEKVSVKPHNGDLKANYDNYFAKMDDFLKEAYEKFKKLDKNDPLRKEYRKFKTSPEIEPWLKSDARYISLTKEHKNDYYPNWPSQTDKELNFNKKLDKNGKLIDLTPAEKQAKEARLKELDKTEAAKIHKFTQFIAFKQKKEFKDFANKEGLSIISDMQIGFDDKRDMWRKPEAFIQNYKFDDKNSTIGCEQTTESRGWGIPAINNGKAAQQLVKERADLHFKYNDGARIDAAWEYINPYVYTNGKPSYQEGTRDFLDIIENSRKKYNIDPSLVIAENRGNACETSATNNIIEEFGWPKINIGGKPNETPKESWYTPGTHDDPPLTAKYPLNELKAKKLAKMYSTNAENVQLMFLDHQGRRDSYNIGNFSSPDNWKARTPHNYEEFTFSQLATKDATGQEKEAPGINMPEILLNALGKKGIKDESLNAELSKYSDILKEHGPMTTHDADIHFSKKRSNSPTSTATKTSASESNSPTSTTSTTNAPETNSSEPDKKISKWWYSVPVIGGLGASAYLYKKHKEKEQTDDIEEKA